MHFSIDMLTDDEKNGEDILCGRDTQYMRPFDGKKYYAMYVVSGLLNTQGGPKRNQNAEVLDTQGNPIPGLYAAGEVTGGIHGGNRLGGNAIVDTVVMGKIAGENAAK